MQKIRCFKKNLHVGTMAKSFFYKLDTQAWNPPIYRSELSVTHAGTRKKSIRALNCGVSSEQHATKIETATYTV